jgi:homoserine O-succinyltransferase
MPVTLARSAPDPDVASLRERRLRRGVIHDRGRRLRLELVNNMPDSAVMATQRQFIRLLEEAARDYEVTLGFVTLSTVERSQDARREMAELYRIGEFHAADAVIVTGAEPRAPELDQEPYWDELTALFDAVHTHAHATLASCLSAHALVWHRDGVRRRRYGRKWSGLYPTEIVTDHPLTAGLEAGPAPHSRWNGLEEADLVSKGYMILTRAGAAGVDMFAKDDGHLTLCLQGHPEYESDTLAREFRRDLGRALNGAAAAHIPDNYYDADAESRLARHIVGMFAGTEAPNLPAYALKGPEASWRRRGAQVVANWLGQVAARKTAASGPTFRRARWGG